MDQRQSRSMNEPPMYESHKWIKRCVHLPQSHVLTSTQIKMQKQSAGRSLGSTCKCYASSPIKRSHSCRTLLFALQTSLRFPTLACTRQHPRRLITRLSLLQYTHMCENVNNNKLIADYTHLLHILRMPADCLFTGFNGM